MCVRRYFLSASFGHLHILDGHRQWCERTVCRGSRFDFCQNSCILFTHCFRQMTEKDGCKKFQHSFVLKLQVKAKKYAYSSWWQNRESYRIVTKNHTGRERLHSNDSFYHRIGEDSSNKSSHCRWHRHDPHPQLSSACIVVKC